MTYIFDMAGGEEYLGEELRCPQPVADVATTSSPNWLAPAVELHLAIVESPRAPAPASGFPAGQQLRELIERLED